MQGELSLGEMLDLQLDDRHPLAARLLPYLLGVQLRPGYPSAGQDLLRGWDFNQTAESPAAAYFNVVWSNLLALTFHDDLERGPLARWWAALDGRGRPVAVGAGRPVVGRRRHQTWSRRATTSCAQPCWPPATS